MRSTSGQTRPKLLGSPFAMKPYTRCALRFPRPPRIWTPSQWPCIRRFATDAADARVEPAWFESLREEMLGRRLTPVVNVVAEDQEQRLESSLISFLPPGWRTATAKRVLPPGHHLVFCNPALPAERLLPDGTDVLHSPGDPYTRRMWAGGKLTIDAAKYFTGPTAWRWNDRHVCSERISDVKLRGEGENAKLFVTIERRFARIASLEHLVPPLRSKARRDAAILDAFAQQAVGQLEGDDASLVEERNLVFMKERSKAELDAIAAGNLAPVRYLQCSYALCVSASTC